MGKVLVIQNGLVANMLRFEGHAIIEAPGPLEALDIALLRKDELHLIVTDVLIKPMSGLKFAIRLSAQGVNIPFLFTAPASIARAIADNLGNNALIEGPFGAIDLARAVKKILSKAGRDAKIAAPRPITRAGLRTSPQARVLSTVLP